MRTLAKLLLVGLMGCGTGGAAGPSRDAGNAARDGRAENLPGQAEAGASAPSGSAGVTGPSQWVIGYYVGYQVDLYPLEDIDWSALTHITFAPLGVNADGTIKTDFLMGGNVQGAAFAKKLSAAAHEHDVKALLMLGGAGLSDSVKPAMGDLSTFVERLIGATRELGFDGIDLDVEAGNFSLDDFITLASALRKAAPELTLTVPWQTVPYGVAVDPRLVTLASHVDRYSIQSFQGGNAGLFTGGDSAGGRMQSWFYGALAGASVQRPYAIDYALEQLSKAGIPKQKLGMGMSFYAACYKIPDTTPPGGEDVSAPRMPTGSPGQTDWCWDCGIGGGDNTWSYGKFYAAGGLYGNSTAAERKWDEEAQEPYLSFSAPKYDAHCGGNTRYVIYEDERSIKAKGAFSRKNGYGGITIWTIQQGWLPDNAAEGRPRNALMRALREGFLAP